MRRYYKKTNKYILKHIYSGRDRPDVGIYTKSSQTQNSIPIQHIFTDLGWVAGLYFNIFVQVQPIKNESDRDSGKLNRSSYYEPLILSLSISYGM